VPVHRTHGRSVTASANVVGENFDDEEQVEEKKEQEQQEKDEEETWILRTAWQL